MEEIFSSAQTFAVAANTAVASGQSFSPVVLVENIYRGLSLPMPDPTAMGRVFALATAAIALLMVLAYVYHGFFMQKIFKKTGTVPAWSAWVPVYGQWKFLEAGKQTWWLIFIPLVNLVFMIVAAYRIATGLRKGSGYIVLFLFFPWLWLILLSSKRVTAISEGVVNDEYEPPEYEPEPVIESHEENDNEGNGPVSSIVTDPTAAATAVATAATAGLDGAPDFDPNNEAAGVKPEVSAKEKSMNPFPEESVFEIRQAEEKAKQQAEIDAANAVSEEPASAESAADTGSTTEDVKTPDALAAPSVEPPLTEEIKTE
jgi:hypothetical protein